MSKCLKLLVGSRLMKIVAMALILFFLLRKIELGRVLTAFLQANILFLVLALGLSMLMVVVRVLKWQALLLRLPETVVSPPVSFRQALKSILGGLAFGVITPARLGEIGRVVFLPPSARLPAGGLFIVDRAIDLVTMLMLAMAGTAGLLPIYWRIPLGAALVALVMAVLSWHVLLPWIMVFLRLPRKPADFLKTLVSGLKDLKWGDLGWNLVLGCCLMVLDVISLFVLVSAFEPVSFQAIAFAFPLILLTNLVPVTPGGIGVREGTAMWLLQKFQVSEVAAFNAALLLYVVNSLLPGILGLLFLREIKGGSEQEAQDNGA